MTTTDASGRTFGIVPAYSPSYQGQLKTISTCPAFVPGTITRDINSENHCFTVTQKGRYANTNLAIIRNTHRDRSKIAEMWVFHARRKLWERTFYNPSVKPL